MVSYEGELDEDFDWDVIDQEFIKNGIYGSNENLTFPDIRNKLSPISNLIAMLEHQIINNGLKIDPIILDEMEQCKKSIEYLSGNKNEN